MTVLLTALAVLYAALALRVSDWAVPSERDWFRGDLFADPVKLRVYHVLGMLETHQWHNRQNMLKGEQVRRSQWLLIGAAIGIGVLVVFVR